MTERKEILQFISANKDFLHKKFHLVKIGLFGSFARDEQSPDSDLDLIVEFEPGTHNLYDLKIQLKELFKKKFNLEIDICREKYIKPTFKKDILKETVYV